MIEGVIKVKALFKGKLNACPFAPGKQYTLDFFINHLNRVTVTCGTRAMEYSSLGGFLNDFDVIL